jgi:hypothetical protein
LIIRLRSNSGRPPPRFQVSRSVAKIGAKVADANENTHPVESASALIDRKIRELGDWRGKTVARVREIIHKADTGIVEGWKWRGIPAWSHGGIVCFPGELR